MIGEVISSTDSVCEVLVSEGVQLQVGQWVDINNNCGYVEKFEYGSKGNLKATVPFFSPDSFSCAPIAPGTPVMPLSKGFFSGKGGIPAGHYSSFGNKFPLFLNPEYLLGPHGAHVNANGISGLATKTSILMTLLWGIEKTVPDSCRIIVNAKHQDLMNIHKPSRCKNDDDYYEKIGIEPSPFQNVKYYGSFGSPVLKRGDVKPFGYSIQNGLNSLPNIFCQLDDSARTITALCERIMKDRESCPAEFGTYENWQAIWTQAPLCEDSIHPNSWNYFTMATVRRFLREAELILKNQNTGVFLNTDNPEVYTMKDIVDGAKAGETIVVDFSYMTATEQFFCMTELVKAIYGNISSKDRTLPGKVCLFMDELNKYGDRREDAHPIRDLLIEIAERGRSLGISLFSAQQVCSHIHPRILANNATRICGRTASEEISKEPYRYLGNQKEWLLRLPKGELMVYHSPFGNNVKIRFPEPPFALG